MGGGPMPDSGAGGGKKQKKALDASVNVVPAIDLFSVLCCFLLLTAVWTQISRLQVQQLGAGVPTDPTTQQQLMVVTLGITERGISLSTSSGGAWDVPPVGRGPDGEVQHDLNTLATRLKELKAAHPEQSAITVAPEDTVPYVDLVRVIDLCNGTGIMNVTVSGA